MINRSMKFTRGVGCDNEFAAVPETMVVFVTPELAKRIVELSEEVKRLGVDNVRLLDSEPSWYRWAEDDEGFPILGGEWYTSDAYLYVGDSAFWWSGYFGRWEAVSGAIAVDDIKQ